MLAQDYFFCTLLRLRRIFSFSFTGIANMMANDGLRIAKNTFFEIYGEDDDCHHVRLAHRRAYRTMPDSFTKELLDDAQRLCPLAFGSSN